MAKDTKKSKSSSKTAVTSTDLLEAFLTPNGKLNRERLTRVNDHLARLPGLRPAEAPRINILARMDDAGSEAIRRAAVQCIQKDPEYSKIK